MMKEKLKKFFIYFSPNIFKTVYYRTFFLIFFIIIWINTKDLLYNFPNLSILYTIIASYIILNLLFNYIKILILYVYRVKYKYEHDYRDNFTIAISQLSIVINHIVFIFMMMHLIGINIKEFILSIGIFAFALAFTFKDYIYNFLNGLSIMFSEVFKIKDIVKIGDYKGRITNINFQNIELKTDSGDFLYIPNSIALSKEVINYSKSSLKNFKMEFILTKDLYPNIKEIKKTIKKSVFKEFEQRINTIDDIVIRTEKVEKDYSIISIEFILNKYTLKIEDKIKSFVNNLIIEKISPSIEEENKS